MTKPMIKIYDTMSDEITEREMNDEEYEIYLLSQNQTQNDLANQAAKAEQRAALLERLGITEEETKLLLG